MNWITPYYCMDSSAPAIVIFPGGGYHHLANHEGEPVARALNQVGLHAFVVRYPVADSVATPLGTLPLDAAAQAVAFAREQPLVDPAHVGVLGFSAGGHLAASLGVHWRDYGMGSRPNAMVLCYPVISSGEFGHFNSFQNLCVDETQQHYFSLEHHVSADTPPTFLWHTVDDASVSVENSMLFAAALRTADISFEAHLYSHGRHGLSLSTEAVSSADFNRHNPNTAGWFPQCLTWLRLQGFLLSQ